MAQVDHAQHNPIEAEDGASSSSDPSDIDSIYDSETGSTTDTLATFIKQYQYLHGRRYDHKKEYIVSNDEKQQDTMDLFHAIYYRAIGEKLYVAPIGENPQRVLDLGTGTGIWSVDFADLHPSAQVVGTDISPIQPTWVPPNCEFEVDDFNQPEWPRTKDSFDFVHCRSLNGAVKDWGQFFRNTFSILKPGGWVELVGENPTVYCDDGTTPADSPYTRYLAGCVDGVRKFGLELDVYDKLEEHIRDAGFDMSTFKHERFPCPIGTWPKKKGEKELGGMTLVNLLQGLEGWSLMMYTQLHGYSREEYDKLLQTWYKDLKNKKQHKYLKVNAIYVQKPQ